MHKIVTSFIKKSSINFVLLSIKWFAIQKADSSVHNRHMCGSQIPVLIFRSELS